MELKSSYENIPHISTIVGNVYNFTKEWAILKRLNVYEDLTILAIQAFIRKYDERDEDWDWCPNKNNIADILFVYLGPAEDFGTSSDATWDGFYRDKVSYIVDDLVTAFKLDMENILSYKDEILKIKLVEE